MHFDERALCGDSLHMKSGCNTSLKLARNFLNKNFEFDLSRVASQNSPNYKVGGYFPLFSEE